MRTCEQLIRALQEGAYDHIFKKLYAPDGNEAAMLRAKDRAVSMGTPPKSSVSCPLVYQHRGEKARKSRKDDKKRHLPQY